MTWPRIAFAPILLVSLASQGKTWEDLYAGPSTPYVKHGVPAAYHQTTWCAQMAIEFIAAHRDVHDQHDVHRVRTPDQPQLLTRRLWSHGDTRLASRKPCRAQAQKRSLETSRSRRE